MKIPVSNPYANPNYGNSTAIINENSNSSMMI
jgi:hypothetical protein